jgi:hypothetical protein
MNIVAIPLLFNYLDRSWAMGVQKKNCFLLRIPTVRSHVFSLTIWFQRERIEALLAVNIM